jgi:hypothetical protein
MPRYLVEFRRPSPPGGDGADTLVARRFPEISVEHRYTSSDRSGKTELWVCRAPSDTHLRRWTRAASLTVLDLRRIERCTPPAPGTR